MNRLEKALNEAAATLVLEVERLLPETELPEARVVAAMRYATLNGGKRLRPFLVLTTAALFNVARQSASRAAAAIEFVHCYSLIHDDLPAMDNDDLRRGLPTCHRAYDEATAILAGDALLTKAFEVLGGASTHPDPQVRADLVVALAEAAGHQGMVGGQMIDMLAATRPMDIPAITRLQRMKTGRLIAFSCVAGPILGKAHPMQRQALEAYAHDLGLVFQITDDLLDLEASAEEMGKKTGKDAEQGKATFVSLLGADRARAQAKALGDQAIQHLESFGNCEPAELLRDTVRYVLERRN
ncbi:MAG: polyprenyl synthetase family protein [Alphaproteobacteria bacterium]|nr:polyprenyl synthetase family protein [Alphaproteobacteria bacterium]